MAYDRRTFAGGGVATTITAGIDSATLTILIAASTGWPTGSAGDFFVVIDRGTASEEKVRIDTRSSLTLTAIASGRGADGTSAVAHSSGAAIELCLAAVDLDEANAHIADTALDHHTQYLTTGRHDIEGRHTFGAAYGTPAAAADVGTTPAAGTGDNPAREDHVHQIGSGAIDASAMFAAGVVDAVALAAAVGLGYLASGYAEVTANQGSITTVTDLTGLTVTVTVGTSRRIRVTGQIRSSNTGANSNLLLIKEGATTLQTSTYVASTATASSPAATAILTPTAGAHTYKLAADVGGGTMTMVAAANQPAFILVEDLGAA
jgi:hypothetical protein